MCRKQQGNFSPTPFPLPPSACLLVLVELSRGKGIFLSFVMSIMGAKKEAFHTKTIIFHTFFFSFFKGCLNYLLENICNIHKFNFHVTKKEAFFYVGGDFPFPTTHPCSCVITLNLVFSYYSFIFYFRRSKQIEWIGRIKFYFYKKELFFLKQKALIFLNVNSTFHPGRRKINK